MRQQLNVALIGVGRMGKIHASVLERIPGIRVVRVADVNLLAAAEVARRFEASASTVEDAIAAAEVEAIVISTPTPTHEQLVLQAVEAGKIGRASCRGRE